MLRIDDDDNDTKRQVTKVKLQAPRRRSDANHLLYASLVLTKLLGIVLDDSLADEAHETMRVVLAK